MRGVDTASGLAPRPSPVRCAEVLRAVLATARALHRASDAVSTPAVTPWSAELLALRSHQRGRQESGFAGCAACSLSSLWQLAENLFASRLSLMQPIISLP